jgi:hypothetical protein
MKNIITCRQVWWRQWFDMWKERLFHLAQKISCTAYTYSQLLVGPPIKINACPMWATVATCVGGIPFQFLRIYF